MKYFLLTSILVISLAAAAQIPVRSSRLASITSNYWSDNMKLNPLTATQRGINTYNHQLEISIGQDHRSATRKLCVQYLDSLNTVDRNSLNEQDALTADIFEFLLKRSLDGLDRGITASCHFERPVDQFVFSFPTSFATMATGTGAIPFRRVKDYDDFIQRMKKFRDWVDTAISNMNAGISHGNTTPRAAMLKVPDQLKPLFQGEPSASVFYKPLTLMPDSFMTRYLKTGQCR